MTCTAKLYIQTDINITLSIISGFVLADIADITLTLSKDSFTKSYTKSGGQISIIGSDIIATVSKTDITSPGIYKVKILVTDTGGNTRGITPCPETLTFYA